MPEKGRSVKRTPRGWSISEGARRVGLNRATLAEEIRKAGLQPMATAGMAKLFDRAAILRLAKRHATSGKTLKRLRLDRLVLENRKLEAWHREFEKTYVPMTEVEKTAQVLEAEIARVVRQIHTHAGEVAGKTTEQIEATLKGVEDQVMASFATLGQRIEVPSEEKT